MKAISEEKSKQNIIRQELQREEDRLDSERRKLEMQQAKMAEKEKDFLQAAQTLKERSEEMDQLFIVSSCSQYYAEEKTGNWGVHRCPVLPWNWELLMFCIFPHFAFVMSVGEFKTWQIQNNF